MVNDKVNIKNAYITSLEKNYQNVFVVLRKIPHAY